jgi:hypothetical protein
VGASGRTRPAAGSCTRHLPQPSRHRALRELSERGLLPVVPLADRTPRVDLVKWRLPGASVLSGRFGGVRQCGEPESGTGAELFFGINAAGDSVAASSGGRSASAPATPWSSTLAAARSPCCVPGRAD